MLSRRIMLISNTISVFLALFMSSCTSGQSKNRTNDLLDIVDIRVVAMMGAEAKAGPLSLGLGGGGGGFGLKGGKFGVHNDFSGTALIGVGTGKCCFHFEEYEMMNWINDRKKLYSFKQGLPPYLYTRLMLKVGFIVGFEVGFNPGELTDLLLGFLGIDLYGDDSEPEETSKTTD